MYPLGDIVLWSAIPIAVLLIVSAAAAYELMHRPLRPQEDPVQRAYLDAKARAAENTEAASPSAPHSVSPSAVR
jgi:hypothetical protein